MEIVLQGKLGTHLPHTVRRCVPAVMIGNGSEALRIVKARGWLVERDEDIGIELC